MPARLAAAALESAPDRALALQVLERLAAAPRLPADAAVVIGLSQAALAMERNELAESLAEMGTTRLPETPEVWFWRPPGQCRRVCSVPGRCSTRPCS